MDNRPKVKTCLWYDNQALPAAEFYVGLLPDSRIDGISYFTDDQNEDAEKKVMLVDFTLSGSPYQALNGGDTYKLNESVSISVLTEDQRETDALWDSLISDGGAESMCGWLKDRFGLSWQIVPKKLSELVSGPNSKKVWPVLMKMRKIEIAELESAANS